PLPTQPDSPSHQCLSYRPPLNKIPRRSLGLGRSSSNLPVWLGSDCALTVGASNGGPGRGGGRKPGSRNATPRRKGTQTINLRAITPEKAAAALAAGDTPLDVLLATMRYYWHCARFEPVRPGASEYRVKEEWDEKLLELASRAADRCIGFCHPRVHRPRGALVRRRAARRRERAATCVRARQRAPHRVAQRDGGAAACRRGAAG